MARNMKRAAPAVHAAYWAKRTFQYGGEQLDRGQIFKLKNLENDRLLVDLGYVAEVPEDASTVTCGKCGLTFLDQRMRDGHGKMRHDRSVFVPAPAPVREPEESSHDYQNRLDAWALEQGRRADQHEEQQVAMEETLAPLDLTKTTASREA